jgi:hypothetical protein
MANVNRLRGQIKDYELRRDELTKQRENALNVHLAARQRVITGKADVSTLETSQTTVSTFNSLISDIENDIAEAELKLENAIIQERADAFERECRQLAQTSKAAGDRCAEAIREFPFAMERSVDKYLENRAVIYRCKRRFNSIVVELIPGAMSTYSKSNPETEKLLEIFFAELESKTDCSVLRSTNQLFVEHAFWLIDYQHNSYQMPLLAYPETFRTALRERAAQIQKKEIEKAEKKDGLSKKRLSIW